MKLLSVESVADSLGVSRQTIMRMILDNTLPAIVLRSGKRKKLWRIRAEQLEQWLMSQETRQRQPAPLRPERKGQ
jgi:excisionase family DNA binding protein